MSEIHYISRVEYCEVRELTAMTVVKKQFALVPPAANFTRLPMVGLASVEVSDKIENKQRVFVSKLAVFLPVRGGQQEAVLPASDCVRRIFYAGFR